MKESSNVKYCPNDDTFVCHCGDNVECRMLLIKYAQVVYCNDDTCLFNKTLDSPHLISRGLNHKPFNDDVFNGVCTRKGGIGLSKHQYTHNNRFKKDVVCKVRSDKTIQHPTFIQPEEMEFISKPELNQWV